MLVSRDHVKLKKASSVLFVFIQPALSSCRLFTLPLQWENRETSNAEKNLGEEKRFEGFRFPRVSYPYLECIFTNKARFEMHCAMGTAIDTKSQEP